MARRTSDSSAHHRVVTGTTTAQTRSPVRVSGTPMTATSATAGCGGHIFDLQGRNIFRVADDCILDATRHADVAVRVHQSEIAGAQPAVFVERVFVERGIGIAEEALRVP